VGSEVEAGAGGYECAPLWVEGISRVMGDSLKNGFAPGMQAWRWVWKES